MTRLTSVSVAVALLTVAFVGSVLAAKFNDFFSFKRWAKNFDCTSKDLIRDYGEKVDDLLRYDTAKDLKRLARQLKACEGKFKRLAQEFVQAEPEKWRRIQVMTEFLEKSPESGYGKPDRYAEDLERAFYENYKRDWSGLVISDEEREVKEPCRAYYKHMESSMYALNLVSARSDSEMMSYMIPLDYCALHFVPSHRSLSFVRKRKSKQAQDADKVIELHKKLT